MMCMNDVRLLNLTRHRITTTERHGAFVGAQGDEFFHRTQKAEPPPPTKGKVWYLVRPGSEGRNVWSCRSGSALEENSMVGKRSFRFS